MALRVCCMVAFESMPWATASWGALVQGADEIARVGQALLHGFGGHQRGAAAGISLSNCMAARLSSVCGQSAK